MNYLAVFCSANDIDEKYIGPAKEFATLLAQNGYGLVWGGSDTGLMKVIASTVQENNGRIVGVSMELFKNVARENADEMIMTQTLGERKAEMLTRSVAIIVLVGGIGTLDEVTEMIEYKKQKVHNKPIIFLNTDNFYEGLKIQLQKMKADGFISNNVEELVYFADSPQEVIDHVNSSIQ